MITHAEYVEAPSKLHDAYFLEIALDAGIGLTERLLLACRRSADPHFNDIALPVWDTLAQAQKHAVAPTLQKRGTYWSLGTGVCVTKALAHHLTRAPRA